MKGGTCQCKNMQKQSKTYKHMQKTCKNTVNESRTLEKLQKYRCMFWQVQPIDQAPFPLPTSPQCSCLLKKINLELNKNQKHPSITRLRFHLFLRLKMRWCDAKVCQVSGDGEIRFLWCKLRTVISQFASASGCDASNTRQLTTSQGISS